MNDLYYTPMKDANNDEPIADGTELVAFGSLNGKEYTVSKINNPTQLIPVTVNVKSTPIKHMGRDLLKQLHLDDILFEDNEEDVSTKKKEVDDEEDGNYTVLTEDSKKMQVSTQSTYTIKRLSIRSTTPSLLVKEILLRSTRTSKRSLPHSLLKASKNRTGPMIRIIKRPLRFRPKRYRQKIALNQRRSGSVN